ncbi:MAG: undecaprenyl-diphosphate phosphatase [Porticoccaceae bacterium]|nr:undecaprenyl-diphosphate phosphatase [Porticoccaceae bacterium]
MDVLQAIWLAVVQGFTEFLPISSSAHLILPSQILGWPDQGLAFDVAVHVGSFAAVVLYFRRDIQQLVSAWFISLGGPQTAESNLAWYIVVATVPAGITGLIFGGLIEIHLRSMAVIATTTILFGLLLGWADLRCRGDKTIYQLSWKTALLVGAAQALALVPGTSRSGITMTAALMLGFDRTSAARFSFLLAIPIIALSGGYKGLELMGQVSVPWFEIIIGTVLSAVTAYICIHSFLRLVERVGMLPFVIYRLLLGGVLIFLILD